MATITPIVKNILVVAGDVSGDLHAARLIEQLKAQDPSVRITAIGGKRMQPLCDEFIYDLASDGATGFVEPLKKMPLWIDLMKKIRAYMETQNPVALIVVDFYGFNHQVLGMAQHRHIPAYYYVTPQVWASRQYRAKRLAALTKKMYVIYPFEAQFHQKFGGNAVFLGNPLLDIMPLPSDKNYLPDCAVKGQHCSAQEWGPATKDKAWKLGILPGSRLSEIKRLTPVFYQTFKKVLKEFPHTQAYLFVLPETDEKTILDLLGEKPHPQFQIVKDKNYELRSQMDYLLSKSGTVTLENALLGLPMLVAYKMSWPTYHIAKMVIKVPYISLANLLANKALVKEFIQGDANENALAAEVMSVFQNPQKLAAQREELLKLRASLGEKGVAERAAKDILTDLSRE